MRWLLAEVAHRPARAVKYWLANLPEDTLRWWLVRLAKLRWRIEHDYRELKDGLALTTSRAAASAAGTTT